MNIIHYTLGFPPLRTGGLVKYSLDLAKSQKDLGHNISILYPGNFSFFSNVTTFEKCEDYYNCSVYELTNALPIPLLYGLNPNGLFDSSRVIKSFDSYIRLLNPQVFHIHTLMGLPIELVYEFKKHNVKIVYTSHDYFGLCPRVNFVDNNGFVCESNGASKCRQCCIDSPSNFFLKIRNSLLVASLKKLIS